MALYTQAQRQQRWRAKHPDKAREWGRKGVRILRLRKFGLTLSDYDKMVAALGGICPGCNKPNEHKLGWMVDHSHTTNKFRGLLCGHCNSVLGHAHDSPDTLERLAAYLRARDVA